MTLTLVNNVWFFVLQAFAWFSDLLVEHAEIFWSLFAVDMDSTLEMQPPDTWDSFPLFQLLNDYLRNDGGYRVWGGGDWCFGVICLKNALNHARA